MGYINTRQKKGFSSGLGRMNLMRFVTEEIVSHLSQCCQISYFSKTVSNPDFGVNSVDFFFWSFCYFYLLFAIISINWMLISLKCFRELAKTVVSGSA